MPENFQDVDLFVLATQYLPLLLSFCLRVVGAFIVLLFGLRLAVRLGGFVRDLANQQPQIDPTLGAFFGSLVRWAITAAVLIAVLQVFGIPATSFVAVLGALTLAIGLSLQGALGNIAAGVMIMIFRPYKLDDYIEVAGVSGSVRDINLFQTVLATIDNIMIMVPNSQAIDGIIKNYGGYTTRRVDTRFSIDYSDNIDQAIGVIRSVINEDQRVFSDPEPFVKVVNLGESSVDIETRLWVNASDFFGVKFDLLKNVKEAFDVNGITIPYPHRVEVKRSDDQA